MVSFIKCDDVRSVSKLRLKPIQGKILPETMALVEDGMRILLNL